MLCLRPAFVHEWGKAAAGAPLQVRCEDTDRGVFRLRFLRVEEHINQTGAIQMSATSLRITLTAGCAPCPRTLYAN